MRPAPFAIVRLFLGALLVALCICVEIWFVFSELGLTRKNFRNDTWPIKVLRAVIAVIVVMLTIA